MKKVFALVALLWCMASCHNEVIVCQPPGINMYFAGFAQNDFEHAMVYTYKKDGVFDSLADSSQLAVSAEGSHDTFQYSRAYTTSYDYMVVLPPISDTYYVTGITLGTRYTESISEGLFDKKKYGCVNPIVSYVVNGTAYHVNPADGQNILFDLYVNK